MDGDKKPMVTKPMPRNWSTVVSDIPVENKM